MASTCHCKPRPWWFLDNGNQRNGMWTTSPALKIRQITVKANSSKPIAVLQRRLNTVDKAIRSVKFMRRRWRSSCIVISLHGTAPARLCVWPSPIHLFHTRITVVTAFPVWDEISPHYKPAFQRQTIVTRVLLLSPLTSMMNVDISFYVSISFGRSALTEQSIALTQLVI